VKGAGEKKPINGALKTFMGEGARLEGEGEHRAGKVLHNGKNSITVGYGPKWTELGKKKGQFQRRLNFQAGSKRRPGRQVGPFGRALRRSRAGAGKGKRGQTTIWDVTLFAPTEDHTILKDLSFCL